MSMQKNISVDNFLHKKIKFVEILFKFKNIFYYLRLYI